MQSCDGGNMPRKSAASIQHGARKTGQTLTKKFGKGKGKGRGGKNFAKA